MRCSVVVRVARPGDAARREELVRQALAGYHTDAFLHFFLQELTLQCSVLSGAVLFIFCGVRVGWCCMLVPALAVLIVALSVWGSHMMLADKLVQGMRRERVGLVAELQYDGRAAAAATPDRDLVIRQLYNRSDTRTGQPVHTRIVGTVSVSEFWGPRNSGWMHALAVDARWRGRGVGAALVEGASARAARDGLHSLEAVLTYLQDAARRLLHNAGWELRTTYQRAVVGAALTLPVSHLGTDLPLPPSPPPPHA